MFYVICSKEYIENHKSDEIKKDGGNKAMRDTIVSALRLGGVPLYIESKHGDSFFSKLSFLYLLLIDYFTIFLTIKPKDILFFQFPLEISAMPTWLLVLFLRFYKIKKIQILVLLHDLNSIRGIKAEKLERAFLNMADVIIAPPKMIKYLRTKKINSVYVEQRPWDYILSDFCDVKRTEGVANIAGNLHPSKAGYVYQLLEKYPNLSLALYGPNFVGNENIPFYKGEFLPEILPKYLVGEVGLIWDGSSIETCEGGMGKYLEWNWPHKLSLYLAANLPVIIWDKAAAATFVAENHIGICASSVLSGLKQYMILSRDEKMKMKSRASEMGNKLREGDNMRQTLMQALSLLSDC